MEKNEATQNLLEAVKSRNYLQDKKINDVLVALENGANVNVKDKDGWTPLHWAASRGLNETCNILIQHGANVKVRDKYGISPFSTAINSGRMDTIDILLNAGADINIDYNNSDGSTALCGACENNDKKFVTFLLERGANPNISDKTGISPLIFAIINENFELCEQLLKYKADPNYTFVSHNNCYALTPFGYTINMANSPFGYACSLANLDIAKLLVQYGANVDLNDESKEAALEIWGKNLKHTYSNNNQLKEELQELKLFIANYQIGKNADNAISDKSNFEWEY